MFIHETHLPQVLPPEAYTCPEQHRREMQNLLEPGWHFIATKAELAREGDYVTFNLLGRPLILWNTEGEIRTYLNVCAHRMCMLTHKQQGKMPLLKCQYHGWEYDSCGDTRRIPDAKSFKPLQKGQLGLKRYRTATLGQLIFVSLADEGPDLPEYLGPGYQTCLDWFGDEWRPTYNETQEVAANWKIPIENVLENYHLGEVHGSTYGDFPAEEECTHAFHDRYTTFSQRGEANYSPLRRLGEAAYRLLGMEPSFGFDNIHFYPNMVFANMGLVTWAQTSLPDGPTNCRNFWRFFHYRGSSKSPVAAAVSKGIGVWGSRFFAKVLGEDADVMPDIQSGLQSPQQATGGGLISTREERIFHFQRYIKEATAEPEEPESE